MAKKRRQMNKKFSQSQPYSVEAVETKGVQEYEKFLDSITAPLVLKRVTVRDKKGEVVVRDTFVKPEELAEYPMIPSKYSQSNTVNKYQENEIFKQVILAHMEDALYRGLSKSYISFDYLEDFVGREVYDIVPLIRRDLIKYYQYDVDIKFIRAVKDGIIIPFELNPASKLAVNLERKRQRDIAEREYRRREHKRQKNRERKLRKKLKRTQRLVKRSQNNINDGLHTH